MLALIGTGIWFLVESWWAVSAVVAGLWGLGSWWVRQPSAPLRTFLKAELKEVDLIVESVRPMAMQPGNTDIFSLPIFRTAVRVRLEAFEEQAVLVWVNPPPSNDVVRSGQRLAAWFDDTRRQILLKTPQRGLGLGFLLDNAPPPPEPPSFLHGDSQKHPQPLDGGIKDLCLSAIQVLAAPLIASTPYAIWMDSTGGSDLVASIVLGYGGGELDQVMVYGGLLFLFSMVPVLALFGAGWLWYSRCVRHYRAWKAALALGDGEARWARVLAAQPNSEGPDIAHIWLPTTDGRVWQGSSLCVLAKLRDRVGAIDDQGKTKPPAAHLLSSNLRAPISTSLLKDYGSWMPVWVFGKGRYIYNLQPRKGIWSTRGVGVLTDRDTLSG